MTIVKEYTRTGRVLRGQLVWRVEKVLSKFSIFILKLCSALFKLIADSNGEDKLTCLFMETSYPVPRTECQMPIATKSASRLVFNWTFGNVKRNDSRSFLMSVSVSDWCHSDECMSFCHSDSNPHVTSSHGTPIPTRRLILQITIAYISASVPNPLWNVYLLKLFETLLLISN